MANKIYRVEKGVRRELSAREVKQTVMKLRGWTSKQYENEYDKLRNRLRGYEAFKISQGEEVKPQSPATILYHQSRAMHRAELSGEEYIPSLEMQRLQSFSSRSTGGLKNLSQRQIDRYSARYEQTTLRQFGKLIESSPIAAEIVKRIKNPVQREKALKDFADELHLKQDELGKIAEKSAVPFSGKIGSDIDVTFDIDSYIPTIENPVDPE